MARKSPGGRGGRERIERKAVQDVQEQLDVVERRRRTVRSRLIDLRSAVATDGREPLVEATTEEPTIASACRAIERGTLEAIHEELVDVVVQAPERVPGDEGTDQLDDVAARLTDHHDELMAAIERLEALGEEKSFDRDTAVAEIDRAVAQTEHIGSAVRRLTQLVATLAPTPATGDGAAEYAVSGTIRHGEEPLADVVVRAVDVDVADEQPLGETTTDEHGAYRVGFDADDFAGAELFGPDLRVEVRTAVGTEIATRETTNAGPEATLDFELPADARVEPTEYALLRHELDEVLGDLRLQSLSRDQRAFLADELELAERQAYPADDATLDALLTAVDLAERTPFSVPLLYGLARTADDLTLESLRNGDPESFAESVGGAVGSGIVDLPTDDLLERLAAGLEALEAATELADGTEVEAKIALETPDGEPLRRYAVGVVDPADERKRLRLRSDANGRIAFEYVRRSEKAAVREFEVTVSNPAGRTVHEGTVTVEDGDATITVERPSPGFSGAETVESIAAERSIEMPDGEGLADATLADVRRAGGVSGLDGDLQVDDETAQRIDALASFDLMTDAGTGAALFDQGFPDQFRVAAMDPDTFVGEVEGSIDRETARRLHTTARTQTYLVDNALTERRTILRNRGSGVADGGDGDVD